jgi:hypothetical protein
LLNRRSIKASVFIICQALILLSPAASKKECDRIIAQHSTTTTSQSSGHLRNVKEELLDDQAHEELTDMLPEPDSNDTNDAELFYFVHVRNHYLRLMRSSSSIHSRHEMQYPIIVDSGV